MATDANTATSPPPSPAPRSGRRGGTGKHRKPARRGAPPTGVTHKPKGEGGRPSKLTPALQTKLCDLLRMGNTLEAASAMCGIHRTTVFLWLRDGAHRDEGDPLREFFDAVEKARGEAEAVSVAIIARAARTQWQAAAWLLERSRPDRWGRRERVAHEHSGPDGGPIEVESARAALVGRIAGIAARTRQDPSPGESD